MSIKNQDIFPQDFPILAIDYGLRNCGFAIAFDTSCANYIDKVCSKEQILEIINEYKPNCILLGLPINLQNKKQSDKVKAFAGNIKQLTKLKVVFQDERFTSLIADSMLKYDENLGYANRKSRSKFKDQTSALVILEMFLGSLKNRSV